MTVRIAPAKLASQYEGGLSVDDLALAYDCHPTTIRAHLDRAGVQRRPRRERSDRIADRAEVHNARSSGMSCRAIGRLVGVSGQAVWKILNASKSTSKGA